MKRNHLILAISFAIILICGGISISYFTSQDSQDNVMTVGDVDITLTEEPWNPEEEHIITAGAVWEKEPVITNTGDNAAYVRIHLKINNISLIEGAAKGQDAGLPASLLDGTLNTTDWQQVGDPKEEGDARIYTFCYNDPVDPNASTNPLFERVKFDNNKFVVAQIIDGLNGTFDISVSADAIQAQGFDNVQDAFTAFDNQQ